MNSVLIVDDHNLLTQGLVYSLREQGFDSHVSSDPDVDLVVAFARVYQPMLALVDLQFGGTANEGLNLIGPLAALTRVLVLTGVSDPAVLGSCLRFGACGVVRKADGFEHLYECVEKALRGEPANSVREREDLLNAQREHDRAEAERQAPFAALSRRELEVLEYMARGLPADEIAGQIYVSVPTVRTHIQAILRKLDVRSQLGAVARVRDAGWAFEPLRH